jgi:hypothetical protein
MVCTLLKDERRFGGTGFFPSSGSKNKPSGYRIEASSKQTTSTFWSVKEAWFYEWIDR